MITTEANRIVKKYDDELLIIEPWGQHLLRVRSFLDQHFVERENALTELHGCDEELIETYYKNDQATIISGKIKAVLDHRDHLAFYNEKGKILLKELIRLRVVKHDNGSEDVRTVGFVKDFDSALKLRSHGYRASNDGSNF